MVRANNANGVQENVEEPLAISNDGEIVVTSWTMWMRLCKDDSLIGKVVTLRLRVPDEEKDTPLKIEGFKQMKKLIIENGSFGSTRTVSINDNRLLDSVKVGSHCFNLACKKSKNSVVSIKKCPLLTSFCVGENSFKNLLKCEFIMNDNLQFISWRKGSFGNCKSFYPRNMPQDEAPQTGTVIGTVCIYETNDDIPMVITCSQ